VSKKTEKKVGSRIRSLRTRKDLTQESLAYELGMSFGNLGKIERGEVDPNTETLYKIARVLKVDVTDFFTDGDAVAEPAEKTGFATKDDLRQTIREMESMIRSEMSKLREELALSKKKYVQPKRGSKG
jgi:transcriptional regulator with XRE-family HTH domain